jgi:tRNA(Ile)-lysidine synthase
MQGFFEHVREALREYALLEPKDRVLVACSGGPDSMALFHILMDLSREYDLTLYMAHLNHGIRKEADEDEAFVRQVAENAGIPVAAESVNCLELSKEWGMSLEGAARKIRYEFFERQAKRLGISKVALGHTAEDQAETILMRLIRGTGLQGMGGIPPIRHSRGISYVRPLIRCQRSDVLDYLSSADISYRTDSTNFRRCCTRNRVRLDLMPLLKKGFNPSIVHNLSRTAEMLREDHLALAHYVSKIGSDMGLGRGKKGEGGFGWKAFLSGRASGEVSWSLDLETLKSQPLGVQRGVLREWLKGFMGTSQGIHFEHIQAILNLMNRFQGGGMLNLPEGIRIYKDEKRLFLATHSDDNEGALKKGPDDQKGKSGYDVNIPGMTSIPDFDLTLRASLLDRGEMKGISSDPSVAFLDYDTISIPPRIRSRLPGDRFHPLGLPSEKKLKAFFIDSKVPQRLRDRWPLLAGGSEIFWVLGLRIGDPYKVTPYTSKILHIDFAA